MLLMKSDHLCDKGSHKASGLECINFYCPNIYIFSGTKTLWKITFQKLSNLVKILGKNRLWDYSFLWFFHVIVTKTESTFNFLKYFRAWKLLISYCLSVIIIFFIFYETFYYFTLPLLAEHVWFGDVRSAEESWRKKQNKFGSQFPQHRGGRKERVN